MGKRDGLIHDPEFPPLSSDDPVVLLKDSSSVSVAITHLKRYLDLPRTVVEALADLKQLDDKRPLYGLYRKYFPQEWACSVASMSVRSGEGYSPREIEFLRLVDLRLFPFDCDYTLDMAAEGSLTDCIQLLPYATRWWDDAQELTLGWQLLLIVCGIFYEDEALNLLDDIKGLEPSLHKAIEENVCDKSVYHSSRLRALCAQRVWPLSELAHTFSLMHYDTGNDWLDVPGDDGSLPFDEVPLRWCEQHIDMLTQTFSAAQEREWRAQALVDWLEADPNTHMRAVLDMLWQASALSSQKASSH